MSKPHKQFAELLDSCARAVVFDLNAYATPPSIKAIDAIRRSLEEHALAFAALGAAFPRVFTPGPTLEQLEEKSADNSTRDTSPGFKSRVPPPIGGGQPPPLPRRK